MVAEHLYYSKKYCGTSETSVDTQTMTVFQGCQDVFPLSLPRVHQCMSVA